MRVQVSGITNLDDALMAIDQGADSLGFIFHPNSSRFIRPEAALSIIEKLPPFIEKVGIFTGGDAKLINKMIATSGISLAQMHFQATDTLYGSLIAPHLRVVIAQREADITYLSERYRMVDISMINSVSPSKALDLSWFHGQDCSKIILFGAFSLEEIEMILPLGFYGVDLGNAIEHEVGKTDRQMLSAFMQKLKRC